MRRCCFGPTRSCSRLSTGLFQGSVNTTRSATVILEENVGRRFPELTFGLLRENNSLCDSMIAESEAMTNIKSSWQPPNVSTCPNMYVSINCIERNSNRLTLSSDTANQTTVPGSTVFSPCFICNDIITVGEIMFRSTLALYTGHTHFGLEKSAPEIRPLSGASQVYSNAIHYVSSFQRHPFFLKTRL